MQRIVQSLLRNPINIIVLIAVIWIFFNVNKRSTTETNSQKSITEVKAEADLLFTKDYLKSYEVDRPYEDESDNSSDISSEPEPFQEEIHHQLGKGKVAEVVTRGQVYDAQGESYYRKNGCDVFV